MAARSARLLGAVLLPACLPANLPAILVITPCMQGHFALVNHQLTRLRNALAITSVLGRAVVIPQMYCGLDRWWAPHAGMLCQCARVHVCDCVRMRVRVIVCVCVRL